MLITVPPVVGPATGDIEVTSIRATVAGDVTDSGDGVGPEGARHRSRRDQNDGRQSSSDPVVSVNVQTSCSLLGAKVKRAKRCQGLFKWHR